MDFQVLVATMHQSDFSILKRMNIKSNCIIANQTNIDEISIIETDGHKCFMVSTSTRGVGLNRNIALSKATADILLFADDDVVYNDDVERNVLTSFDETPQADVIIFGIDILKNGKVVEKRRCRNARLHVWNSMKYGTYRIAVKKESIAKLGIRFNENFGGGCKFGSGEDSIFIKQCFDKGLKVYSNEYSLGSCSKDSSSWFSGCNEKYFYDKGVLFRILFPKTAYFTSLYFAINCKKETDINVFKRIKLIYSGIWHGKELVPYEESYEKNSDR